MTPLVLISTPLTMSNRACYQRLIKETGISMFNLLSWQRGSAPISGGRKEQPRQPQRASPAFVTWESRNINLPGRRSMFSHDTEPHGIERLKISVQFTKRSPSSAKRFSLLVKHSKTAQKFTVARLAWGRSNFFFPPTGGRWGTQWTGQQSLPWSTNKMHWRGPNP